MEKNHTEELLNESLRKMRAEKMDWDFEEFLQKTDAEKPQLPMAEKSSGNKIYYAVAASVAFILGSFFIVKNFSENKNTAMAELVRNEIIWQKNAGALADSLEISATIVAVNDTIKKTDTLEIRTEKKSENDDETEILNKILPRRGRLRKPRRALMAKNTFRKVPENQDSITYQPNFVTVNGKNIDDEEVAIKIARGALNRMSAGLSKTFTEIDIQNAPGN